MGKRSSFERKERDFYPTPYEAVVPLFDHLNDIPNRFIEPCAGDGDLVNHLMEWFVGCRPSDIEPKQNWIEQKDALELTQKDVGNLPIITNPPWSRDILHPMIEHFRTLTNNTWLLFDADWMHTKQARPYLLYCEKIVSVGRIKWIPDSKHTGKDNCAWYNFRNETVDTVFIGR